jgi:microbial collagenase
LPAGLSSIEIQTSGGSGNADLYVRAGNWPTTTQFDGKSTQPDNNETVTLTNPPTGWCYIMVVPAQAFSEVQILARFHH